MSVPDSAAAGTGVLISKFRLFSMTPQQPTSLSSPTMPPSTSRSEKLLRDALLRDERERQQQSPSTSPPTHKRRHSHIPTSTYSASTSATWEDYVRGSFLFRPAMSNPRSPSPSPFSFSQGNERERDGDHSPVRKLLFHGGDPEGNNRPQHRQSHHYQQQRQHSPTSYRRSSPSPKPSRRSTSTSPSPSPLYMRRRQEGPISPNIHTTTLSHGQGEPLPMTPHEQVLRGKLERVSAVEGARRDENEVRDEQGSCPWRLGAQSTAGASGSSSGSITSGSFNNSSHSHSQIPRTTEIQARAYHPTSTPNRHRPSSPHPPGHSPSLSHKPLRYQTDSNSHPPVSHPQSNPNSPRIPITSSSSSVALNASGKLMKSSSKPTPLPLVSGDAVEEELRLPTPPPTPPSMARVPLGNDGSYVPSPYKTATANGTPTKIPVRTQKKEGELEMRRPTQGPAAALGGNKGKEKEPLRLLECSSVSSRRRQRDITITQQSLQALRSTNVPANNTDGHSVASTESNSTSGSSISHSCVGHASGYCACSSHSSLDGPIQPQLQRSFSADIHTGSIPPPRPHLSQSNSNPSSPKPFNARKASTQCRAMQGYVSFASVEGLGEPPSLVGDGFDAANGSDADGGGGKGNGGKGRMGPFLPLGVWSAAWGWKKFLGVSAVEGQEQGVVV